MSAASEPGKPSGVDLTVGSIPRHLIVFALPMLLGSLLQTAHSFINAIWVGRGLGETALAAVTVSQPAVFVLIAMANGLTLATNVLISQFFGARNWAGLKHVVQTSVVTVTLVSIGLALLGELIAPSLLRLVNTPPEVYPQALPYLRVYLLTLPFAFGLFQIGAMLRGTGDSRTPVYFQTVAVITNAALDPLLIFGWLGFPRLGLTGAAWATVIGQGMAVLAMIVYLAYTRPIVTPDWRRLVVDWPTARLMARIGLPSMIQQSAVSFSMMFIIGLVNAFGTDVVAAFGAGLRIDQVAFLPAMTIGMAASTLAGQNIGAGKHHRVLDVFWWGLLISGGISLVIAAAAFLVPQIFLRAFVTDAPVLAEGVEYLRIMAITYVLYAVMFVSNGIINGAGHTVVTTVFSIVSLLGVRVALAFALSQYALRSARGVWIAMVISVGVGMLMSLTYYASGRWKQRIIRQGLAPEEPDPPQPGRGEA